MRITVVSPRSEFAPLKFAPYTTEFAPQLTKVDRVRPIFVQSFSYEKVLTDRRVRWVTVTGRGYLNASKTGESILYPGFTHFEKPRWRPILRLES